MNVSALAVQQVAEIEEGEEAGSWLVEGLWHEQGVGFLCGNPKANKTWLALEIALSVASQTPVLGQYQAKGPTPVLIFAAEDRPLAIRRRLHGMAAQRGLSLESLPIRVVLERSLRLETEKDQERLRATIAQYRPRLLVLDPFVRLARVDENSSREVAAVLGHLRQLQHEYQVAILIVHHARKSSGHAVTGGMALRGSGDFWAWSDSNLFLSRKGEQLRLVAEHRSAPAPKPIALELCSDEASGPYLRSVRAERELDQTPASLGERILSVLADARAPLRSDELRSTLRVRMQSLLDALREHEREGRLARGDGGWRLLSLTPAGSSTELGETEAGSAGEQPAKG